jgi:hypothetical protein
LFIIYFDSWKTESHGDLFVSLWGRTILNDYNNDKQQYATKCRKPLKPPIFTIKFIYKVFDFTLVIGEEGPEVDDLYCKRDLTNAEQRVQQRRLLHVERTDDMQKLQQDEGVGENGVLG